LSAVKEILQYVGASDCDMEKGSLRCDVNVSVRREEEDLRTKVELKNLNSFRNVAAAIEHETARQIEAYESGVPVLQETRLFDAQTGATRSMRGKEDAHDYRYLPEPDLPPVSVPTPFLERQRSSLPELPAARRERYQIELGLSAYDAGQLTSRRAMSDFFEATARLSGSPKAAANWITNEVARHLADREIEAAQIDELPFKPFDLADLIGLIEKGRVHKAGARTILRAMFETGKAPGALLHELDLVQVADLGQLEAWCRAALEGRESIVADVRAGKHKAVGALLGAVMQASGGSANPRAAREILMRLIADGG
jgi:aspartyl-tRNA(Asn)/glutamyl-tRNA(Gln) amidotransferase subunit B